LPFSDEILLNLSIQEPNKDVRKALIDSTHINDAGVKYELVNWKHYTEYRNAGQRGIAELLVKKSLIIYFANGPYTPPLTDHLDHNQ